MATNKIERLKKEIASMEAVYSKQSTSEGTKKILRRSIDAAKAKLEKQEQLGRKLKTAMYGPKPAEQPKKDEPKKEEPAKPKKAAKPSTALSKLMRRVRGKGYEPYKGKKIDLLRDAGKKAKAPGKKVSKSGRTYWESRPNRVDIKQKAKSAPYLKEGGTVPSLAYGDMVYNTLENALSSIKTLVKPQNYSILKKDKKYMVTTNRRSGIFSKEGWENFGHVLSNSTLYRGTIGRLEYGGVAGYDEGGEMEYDSYDEAKFNMDKFMYDEVDFNEFHSIQASGDADQMAMFIEENLASEDKMYQYFPKDGSIEGFAEYLVKERAKGGYMSGGGEAGAANIIIKLSNGIISVKHHDGSELLSWKAKKGDWMRIWNRFNLLGEKKENGGEAGAAEITVELKNSKITIYHSDGTRLYGWKAKSGDWNKIWEVLYELSDKKEDGGMMADGGNTSSPNIKFMKWYVDWSKGVDKDVYVSISIPNEYSSPIKEDGGKIVILDVIEKKGDADAKKYMDQILKKADEFGVSIYLEPIPRTHNLKSEEHKKKITKDYLIKYYQKFGFENTVGGFMVREPKMTDGGYMAKGGSVEEKYEVELFFKGLSGENRKIGKYVVSQNTLDNLEDEWSHILSIDVIDESEKGSISWYNLKKEIYAKGKEKGLFADGGMMAKGGATEHGLMVGDMIVLVKGSIIGIIDENGEPVSVNIETGDRRSAKEKKEEGGETEYAGGGDVMKEYEKVEGTNYELKIQVYYDKGGMNYFTSRPEQRGYYASVSPVQVERRGDGITVESYSAFSGVKMLVLPVQRQSPKAEAEARKKAMEVLPELKEAIKERIKSKLGK